ncbi:FAD-dependent monooxygenase [Corynebacterium sp. YIM 101645]|uniref:FAD-dependent monooxygenase n=1 Tax=Corynebacterium lemuris TaxID=1859292 RepID=A0ABT2FUM8_9CORY|nr:FAD-dependent monooxygenase [Corynebacterium lemuris]MCS5478917.1 FAD-dependent monooxygenase [Corynebacterium lemuris]
MAHTENAHRENALVVGGGIGGLATALALSKVGYETTVAEQAEAFGEVGAGLQLGPNAIRILDSWGLLDKVSEIGFHPENIIMKDALTGEEITRMSLGEEFQERYGAPYIVIHRTDLHAILLDACRAAGTQLLTDTRIEVVAEGPEGTVAQTADGRRFEADVVIGADGLHSNLRKEFVGDEVVPSGYVAYRGTVPADAIADEQNLNDVVVWAGPGCHLVQYRLRAGAVLNIVAVFESQKFLRGEENFGDVEELDAVFADCHPRVRHSVEHIGRQRRWPLFDREPADFWGEGRVVLLGDAAHPMLQYLAQGCCQALEDAKTLEVLAGRHSTGTATPWPQVISDFTEIRVPRTGEVQTRARLFGEICHADGGSRLMRNELLKREDLNLFNYADWIYLDRIQPLIDEGTRTRQAAYA